MKEANKGVQMWPANNLAHNENVRSIIKKTEAQALRETTGERVSSATEQTNGAALE